MAAVLIAAPASRRRPPAARLAVGVQAERGDAALRLGVFGQSLVRDGRAGAGWARNPPSRSLDLDAGTLVVEERRLYE